MKITETVFSKYIYQSLLLLVCVLLAAGASAQVEVDDELERDKLEDVTPATDEVSREAADEARVEAQSDAATAQVEPKVQASRERIIEEVIVTVERREQSLQGYEGTAVNFSGDDMKMQGIQNLADLSESTPGIEIANKGPNTEVWIRGIGSSNNTELGDPAAATHLDGVYIPRPAGIGSVFFDIQRVEVNVGPQGTLRGRNATAGSVNIVSWKPGLNQWNGGVEVEVGNYNQTMYTGALNVPIGDTMAVRVAAYSLEHDSYYNDVGPLNLDLAEAEDNTGFRGQFLFEPNDKLSILLAGDYVSEQGSGYSGTNYANPLGNGIDPDDIDDPRDVWGRGLEPELDLTHWGARVVVNYDFGFANLEATASYRDLDSDYQASTPLTPDYQGVAETLQPLNESIDNWSRYQSKIRSKSTIYELRLLSPTHERFYYTLGTFYFDESQETFLASTGDRGGFFQGSEFNQPDTDGKSYSAYGDFTFAITDRTRFTAGLRYTYDEKTRTGINARYAFALGGFDVNTGDPFACCLGARVGTEGFEFAGFGRKNFEPDSDGNGEVSEQEFYDFYADGIKSYGENDNIDEIIEAGPTGGDAPTEDKVDCLDTNTTDGLICNADGKFAYSTAISPDNSITPQDGKVDDTFVDWRIRLGHDLSDNSLVYGLIATGHKSGGFNDTFKDPEIGADISPTYGTEQVTMYELGWKNEFELGPVPTRLNASAFYYDYTDQVFTSLLSVEQALEFNGSGSGNLPGLDPGGLVVSFSFNAADSEIYGMQLDGLFELPWNFNLSWTALWLEAEILEADEIQDFRFQADVAPDEAVFRSIDGNRLPYTPQFQFNAALSQFIDVEFGSFDYVVSTGWRDEQFLTIFNSKDFVQPEGTPRKRLDDTVDAYWTVDAGAGYSHGDGRLRVEAFVNNVTDEVQNAATIITQFDNTRFFTRPRTYGMRVKYNF